MAYTLTGRYRGRTVTIEYSDSKEITGDDEFVFLLEAKAELMDGFPVGPIMGKTTRRNHLKSPISALFLMWPMFESPPSFAGEHPYNPELPAGAIASRTL